MPPLRGLVAMRVLDDGYINWKRFDQFERPMHGMIIQSYTVYTVDPTGVFKSEDSWEITIEGAWQQDDMQEFRRLVVPKWFMKAINGKQEMFYGG
jgi:hypothetical protein